MTAPRDAAAPEPLTPSAEAGLQREASVVSGAKLPHRLGKEFDGEPLIKPHPYPSIPRAVSLRRTYGAGILDFVLRGSGSRMFFGRTYGDALGKAVIDRRRHA